MGGTPISACGGYIGDSAESDRGTAIARHRQSIRVAGGHSALYPSETRSRDLSGGDAGFGLESADCWIIEDSLAGVRAGKAAGSMTVAITTTFDRDSLSGAGAELVIDSFPQLRHTLEAL